MESVAQSISCYRRLFVQTGFAFLAALVGGSAAVRCYDAVESFWIFLAGYLTLTAALVAAYLWLLRRLYGFSSPARLQWFVVRGCVVDPIASTFILALIFAVLQAGSSGNPRDGDYLWVLYFLLWFLDLVLVGRHCTDLRPYLRGESADIPWRHHDGGLNCPVAILFHPPPQWLGEVVSAGSSLRRGEELPALRDRLLLALWGGFLGSLLCVALLFAASRGPFPQLVFVLPLYAMIGAVSSIILLYRQRICSYVGTRGAVQYTQDLEGGIEEWSVLFDDYQFLKGGRTHHYCNGVYNGTSEDYRFETADASDKKYFSFNWDDPAITRASPDLLPDVRKMFWQKIETLWANR